MIQIATRTWEHTLSLLFPILSLQTVDELLGCRDDCCQSVSHERIHAFTKRAAVKSSLYVLQPAINISGNIITVLLQHREMAIPMQSNVLKPCPCHIDTGLAKILHRALVVQDVHAGLASQIENWRSCNVFQPPRFVGGVIGLDCTWVFGYQPICEFNLPDLFCDQLAGSGNWRVISYRHIRESICSVRNRWSRAVSQPIIDPEWLRCAVKNRNGRTETAQLTVWSPSAVTWPLTRLVQASAPRNPTDVPVEWLMNIDGPIRFSKAHIDDCVIFSSTSENTKGRNWA